MQNKQHLVNYLNEKYIEPQQWEELVKYLELKLLSDNDFKNKEILEIYRKVSCIYYPNLNK